MIDADESIPKDYVGTTTDYDEDGLSETIEEENEASVKETVEEVENIVSEIEAVIDETEDNCRCIFVP